MITSFAFDLRIVPPTPPLRGDTRQNFFTSRLRPGVQPLIILYTNFELKEKGLVR